MHQVPAEVNYEYLDRFNYQPQNLILERRKTNMCNLKTIHKVGETTTPEKVITEEEKFMAAFFCYWQINLDVDNYLKI